MDWVGAWEEFRWLVGRLGLSPMFAFVMAWYVSFFLWLVALVSIYGEGGAVGPAAIASELTGAVFMVVPIELSKRRKFVAYTIARALRAKDFQHLGVRISKVPLDVIYYLGHHVWEAETFLLTPLRRADVLPETERPQTPGDVAQVVTLGLVERASAEAGPWRSLQPFINSLSSALGTPTEAKALRDALCQAYRDAEPWHRQRVLNPRPGRVSRFLEPRRWFVPLISGLAIVLTNVIVALELLSRR